MPRPWGAFHGSCVSRTQPSSKRPIDLPRSAATCEGGGGTVPPHCPPAHARAASGTSVRLLSPCTRSACDRGPPALMPAWHALLPSLAAKPWWPSCWCAQCTPCWPGAAARTVASTPAVRPRASLRRSPPLWGPGLDAGALRQYIAKPCKEEGKPAEGQTQTERPSSPWQADARVERKPRGAATTSLQAQAGAAQPLPSRSTAIGRAP